MNGFINVLKPPGMTSHDVVSFIRRVLGIKKVGHTGTLDPDAAGVLPVCIGKATRLVEYITELPKSYRAEMVFGIATDTQDISGNVIATGKNKIGRQDFNEAVNNFIGEITQVPPMVSAIKHKGVRLYELARKGVTVKRPGRLVTIYSIKTVRFARNSAVIDVTCSKGTYIRTLCYDIGNFLGTVACLTVLIRTKSGPFDIQNALTLEQIKKITDAGKIKDALMPLDYPLSQMPRVTICPHHYSYISNGRSIKTDQLQAFTEGTADGRKLRIYYNKRFLAVGSVKNGELKPDKLFI